MGVDGAVLRSLPLFFPKVLAHPAVALFPARLGRWLFPCALETLLAVGAPAGVAGQRALLFRGGLPAFLADLVQELDRGLVLVEAGDLAAAYDLKRVFNVEVAGARVGRADFLGRLYCCVSGSSIRFSRSACSRASVTGIPPFISRACSSHIFCWHT